MHYSAYIANDRHPRDVQYNNAIGMFLFSLLYFANDKNHNIEYDSDQSENIVRFIRIEITFPVL